LIDPGVLPILSLVLIISMAGIEIERGEHTDIGLVDVGVNETELGLVVGVLDGGFDNLEHGSDT
jgi:hypothetical protein